MAYHSPRSPSGWDKWSVCHGSIRMEEGRPDRDSADSAKGTFLHTISALCVQFGLDPYDFVGIERRVGPYSCTMTEEDAALMVEGINVIEDLGLIEMYVEKRVSLDNWSAGDSGTMDLGGWTTDTLVVADWKWGAGEEVSPIENGQLKSYMLGFWFDIARKFTTARKVKLIVLQPYAGGTKVWETTLDHILEFGNEFRHAAMATRRKDAPLVPGKKQCRWCKAKDDCRAFTEWNMAIAQVDFADLDAGVKPINPDRLTAEEKSLIVKHDPIFRQWLDSIYQGHLNSALAGFPTPGFKAVTGKRGPRQFIEPKKVEPMLARFLGDRAYEKKIITPTEAEKRLDPVEYVKFRKFIRRSPGKPALAPIDDERKAIPAVDSLFKDLTKED